MMDEKTKADYERAALALDTHEVLPFEDSFIGMEPWAVIAWKAWDVFNDREPVGTHIHEIDRRAARHVRELLAKGESLPWL